MIKNFEQFNDLSESYYDSVKRNIEKYVLIISNEDKITNLFYFDSKSSGERAFVEIMRRIERIFGVDGKTNRKSDEGLVWEYENPTRGDLGYKYGKIILSQCGDEDDYEAYAEEWFNRLKEFEKEYEKDLE